MDYSMAVTRYATTTTKFRLGKEEGTGDVTMAIVRRRVEFERLEVRPSGSLEIEKEGGASLAGTASIRGVLMERPEHSNWHNRHKN